MASPLIRVVLTDLSGTLHVGDAPTPGAVAAHRALLQRTAAAATTTAAAAAATAAATTARPLELRYVTNTTKECAETLRTRLRRIGFDGMDGAAARGRFHTSLVATAQAMRAQRRRPLLLLEPDAWRDFDGVVPYAVLPPLAAPANGPDAAAASGPPDRVAIDAADAVVVGYAPSAFHYEGLNAAFGVLMRPDSALVAVHQGRYLARRPGELALGPGPFVAALTYASGKAAQLVGKPRRDFFVSALPPAAQHDLSAVAMIGDDADDDILAALDAGIGHVYHVQTGKYRPGDEARTVPRGARLVPDFAAAVRHILHGDADPTSPQEG
ncbi:hypothetical protein CXG81DRAFT_26031 [Caulochytrium protostelioides]|uniref:HAD-like protein n=1 Tax=Caulochytrium protostelioides TaxID=1555241 RepID=A0A4P9X880_9FUNG|nr:hypothetical protein CXG81DRAFT_26031 [Caulochytrium protostelioides]|eukprot:RKP01270.1 hypothetical protein CXG81DRAFT_26031 [Caulochytrium protostelioides]